MSTPPLVIAHGGGEGLGPSNMIEGMERSVAAGADILDVDLWMTRDGVIVARHDRDVATTTDGTGNIDELTFAELQQLDAAARSTGEPFATPVKLPSLEQILVRLPDERISLELKQVEPSMADTLCAVLQRTGRADDVYLSATTTGPCTTPETCAPKCCWSRPPMPTSTGCGPSMKAMGSGARPRRSASRRTGKVGSIASRSRPHRCGMALFTWTVDDPEVVRSLAEVGVYTSRPDIARQVFDAWAAAAN